MPAKALRHAPGHVVVFKQLTTAEVGGLTPREASILTSVSYSGGASRRFGIAALERGSFQKFSDSEALVAYLTDVADGAIAGT